jgi:hypothetical protein
MTTATAPTSLGTVSDDVLASAHEFQDLLDQLQVPEADELSVVFDRMQETVGRIRSEAARVAEFVRSPQFQAVIEALRDYSAENDVSTWIAALYRAKSFDGLKFLLLEACKVAARRNVGGFLRQLATNRDRHGTSPGRKVTAHPHIARGPNSRRSILRSSAGLVGA